MASYLCECGECRICWQKSLSISQKLRHQNADKIHVFVYVLIDPRISRVFYVGSSGDPSHRLIEHRNESWQSKNNIRQTTKQSYIYHMLKRGVTPVVSVLEVCTLSRSLSREQYWIEVFALDGHPITNRFAVTAGNSKRIYKYLRKSKRSA